MSAPFTVRVVHCTPNAPRNPYYTVLRPFLSEFGIDIRYTADRDEIGVLLGSGWAEVFHIHQLEPFYRAADAGTTEKRAIDFAEWLREQRRGGGRLVHTVHNRRPHDGLYPDVDKHLVGPILGVANQVVVLGRAANAHLETIRPHGEIRVVPHPSLIGAHGPRAPRREARAALSIAPDEWIVLSLGRLMPYKGHRIIIDAFERAQLPASRLVIVGSGHADKEYTTVLEERMLALGNTPHRLGIGLLPDEEVPLWLGAADVSVFAFEELLMSTSVMLSLSYGSRLWYPTSVACPNTCTKDGMGSSSKQVTRIRWLKPCIGHIRIESSRGRSPDRSDI